MIERPHYLEKLIAWKDRPMIKVVTGIRRCGKSTLFVLFQQYLRTQGVTPEQIISLNLEEIDNEALTDYKALYRYLMSKLVTGKMTYIFLDEIQNVPAFQKAVDSLYIKPNVDIYITGSNASLLSGELATFLSGRYIEIKMLPLSFKEYISAFPDKTDLTRKFRMYTQLGAFPYLVYLNQSGQEEQVKDYLQSIYNTVILKDVVGRKGISNVGILDSIIRFLFDNVGNITSSKKISDTLTSAGRKVSPPTVENYLTSLTDSFILYKATRYDITGKQYLQTAEKYFVADLGLQRMLLGSKKQPSGHNLENVVYLELLRRGYEVYIGKLGTKEVDFFALKNGITEYYQVSQTVQEETTLQRELDPLTRIKDHNRKFLLTMDEVALTTHNGIIQMNLLDWLLE